MLLRLINCRFIIIIIIIIIIILFYFNNALISRQNVKVCDL